MALRCDRSAGWKTCGPGLKSAPAHAYGSGPTIVPPITSEPSATDNATVDLPPAMESVDSIQPAPNFEVIVPSSKLLISPDCTAGLEAACTFDSAMRFANAARSKATPPFQMPAMSRVAVMSFVGSP